MPDNYNGEIDKAIRHAAQSGEILLIAHVSKAIASRCGGSARLIAEALTQAGIRAGVTLQFGMPE